MSCVGCKPLAVYDPTTSTNLLSPLSPLSPQGPLGPSLGTTVLYSGCSTCCPQTKVCLSGNTPDWNELFVVFSGAGCDPCWSGYQVTLYSGALGIGGTQSGAGWGTSGQILPPACSGNLNIGNGINMQLFCTNCAPGKNWDLRVTTGSGRATCIDECSPNTTVASTPAYFNINGCLVCGNIIGKVFISGQ